MMRSCLTAFFLWLPVLIYKFFKGIGMLISWALQVVCGVPLYFCRPSYRIPGKILGAVGLFFTMFAVLSSLIAIFDQTYLQNYPGGPFEFVSSVIMMGGIGVALLLACRFLIRRGSI